MLATLDSKLGQVYNKIVGTRVVSRTKNVLPLLTSGFGIEIYVAPDYSTLQETMKEYRQKILHSIKKYLMR